MVIHRMSCRAHHAYNSFAEAQFAVAAHRVNRIKIGRNTPEDILPSMTCLAARPRRAMHVMCSVCSTIMSMSSKRRCSTSTLGLRRQCMGQDQDMHGSGLGFIPVKLSPSMTCLTARPLRAMHVMSTICSNCHMHTV